MAVAVTEEHQCRVIKWTEAREAKCFLADELDTDMHDEHSHILRRKLQVYIPKPNFGKDAKRPKQLCLHALDKCDPLGLGLMWDTCFLRLVDHSHAKPAVIPLTRELLLEALAGLQVSQAVHHDLFQDAAVMCDAPSQNDIAVADATDASDDEQLTIKSIAEEVDLGEDDEGCDVTDEEGSDQDQDDDEEEEFEEEEEL